MFLFKRGGVPVFSLPTGRPKPLSFWASSVLEGSPTLPPGDCVKPVCIMPPKNVPVVKIMAGAEYTVPSSVTIDLTTELSIFMSITDP